MNVTIVIRNFDILVQWQNWTVVCRLDSDGDGRTNGAELGDPDCRWKPGVAPPRSNRLSHPGQFLELCYRL